MACNRKEKGIKNKTAKKIQEEKLGRKLLGKGSVKKLQRDITNYEQTDKRPDNV